MQRLAEGEQEEVFAIREYDNGAEQDVLFESHRPQLVVLLTDLEVYYLEHLPDYEGADHQCVYRRYEEDSYRRPLETRKLL